MGIPAYFRNITKKYSNIVSSVIDPIGYLYLDLNCGIHKCCREILDKEEAINLSKDELEDQMIENIIQYIVKLYNFTKPSELLYIAIDGVAPRAKMVQQRVRRFKSKKEYNEIYEIKKKYNLHKPLIWDTNAITPGTVFMSKLSKGIEEYFKLFTIDSKKIILSDSNVPGEGEHKIFNYIKNNDFDNTDLNHVIYGLDADLIMLSLSCNITNICLIREELEFDPNMNTREFLYLNINNLADGIIKEMIENGLNEYGMNKWDLINDYIVLCFLLGNDFIPHMLSLEIRHGGLEIILDAFINIYNNRKEHLIVDKEMFNMQFLLDLLINLSSEENKRLNLLTKKILSYHWYPNSNLSEMDKEINKLQNYPLFNRELEEKYSLGKENEWRNNYYTNILRLDKEQVKDLCMNYYEGIIWTLGYYFKKCPDINWYYRFQGGPSIESLIQYAHLVNNVVFSKETEILPYEQLLMVLPVNSNHLLPTEYKKLQLDINSPIIEYYPIDYKLDSYYKRYYWECTPILPIIDYKKIKNSTKKLDLTKDEKERNLTKESLLIK